MAESEEVQQIRDKARHSERVEVFRIPDKGLESGRQALAKNFKRLLVTKGENRCQLQNKDHERVVFWSVGINPGTGRPRHGARSFWFYNDDGGCILFGKLRQQSLDKHF